MTISINLPLHTSLKTLVPWWNQNKNKSTCDVFTFFFLHSIFFLRVEVIVNMAVLFNPFPVGHENIHQQRCGCSAYFEIIHGLVLIFNKIIKY